ncbi:MAG: flagellar filament outer layer protein FlaA [Brevinemataceae bacterium]
MKRVNLQYIMLSVFVAVISTMVHGNTSKSFVIQSFILSDFGDEYDAAQSLVWKPTFSEYVLQVKDEGADSNQNNGSSSQVVARGKNPDTNFSAVRYAEAKPDGITDVVAVNQKYVLGVKAQYTLQGYNWIELRPNRLGTAQEVAQAQKIATSSADNGQLMVTNAPNSTNESAAPSLTDESHPFLIPFRGQALEVSLWAWGGQYGWWIEAYVRDYLNYQYRFPLGNLLYSGWRQKRIGIPDSVIQSRTRLPASQVLTFEMLKLWSFPSEKVDQFYAYFDLLQHATYISTDVFNGKNLADDVW